MSESTFVIDHINTLNTMFAQLTSSNFNIVENKRVFVLLQSLPDSYDQLVIDMTNNNVADCLYFDDVVKAILEEDFMRMNKDDRQESSKHIQGLAMTGGFSMECGLS